jgi:hypothetical protein
MGSVPRSATPWLAVSVGLAACAIAALASADEGTKKTAPAFESLDRNADNRLSRTEAGYNRALLEIFVISDADGDGFVSRAEYDRATSGGSSEIS